MKRRFIAVLPALLLLTVAYASTKKDWEQTVKSNSIAAYEEFLRKHPQSEFSEEARSKLDGLAYTAAKTNASIASYEKYLRDFPEGKFVLSARTRLDLLCFGKSDTSVALYEKYLAGFPNGAYAEDARRRIANHPLMTACSKGKASTVENLLANGSTLSGSTEASTILMRILQRAAERHMDYLRGTQGEVLAITGVSGISPEDRARLLSVFKLLLRAGADPDALRIKGFKQGGYSRTDPNGYMVEEYSNGENGEIVPANYGGLSALEFTGEYDLPDFRDALRAARGDR